MCFIKLQTSGSEFAMFQRISVYYFRMDRGRQLRMPREALIVIGDIIREAEDLSEALYNATSKFTPLLGSLDVIKLVVVI